MSSTAREWSQKYDNLKRKIQNQRINGHQFTTEEIKTYLNTIHQLDQQLSAMGANSMEYEIAQSEIARRMILLDNLKKQTSNAHFVGSQNSPDGTNTGPATYNPVSTTDRGLIQRQQDIMRLQDSMIMEIGTGVDRLHGQAVAIGEEAKVHIRLLDDLDSNVDIATAALQAETKRAENVKDKAKVCYMYICIAVEVLILLILIILTVAK